MYIPQHLANYNNQNLISLVGVQLEGKVVKVRWNNTLKNTEIIYEVQHNGATLYVVDLVTEDKRLMYLGMLHARRNTVQTALHRPNSTLQCSLAACFGNVEKFYEIRAILKPIRANPILGKAVHIAVEVVASYDKPI